jgi:hypothetical protein
MRTKGPTEISLIKPANPVFSHPRLYGAEVARKYGQSDQELRRIMFRIENLEQRLRHLFGAPFEAVKFKAIKFVENDRRMPNSSVGLEWGRNLILAPQNTPPSTFSRRLIHYAAFGYANALLLNRDVLWQSLTARGQNLASMYFRVKGAQDLDNLADAHIVTIFLGSLESGLNNPFVSGLKTDLYKMNLAYDWFWERTHDGDSAEAMAQEIYLASTGLIAERVVDLLLPPTEANLRVVRESIEELLASIQTSKMNDADCLPSAILARVHAEKTGNADLLHYLEERTFAGAPYEELCRILSALWDQIGLKSPSVLTP